MAQASALEREVEELMQFLYLMPVAVARMGAHGEVEMLNPMAVQLLHDLDIDAGSADGPAILDALQPGLADQWRDSVGRIGPVLPPQRCSPARPGGAPLHLSLKLTRPDQRCTMLVLENVTTIVEHERELARQRQRIGLVLEHIQGYCVAMLDEAGCVAEWNPSIGRLLGVDQADVVGKPLFDLLHADAPGQAPVAGFHEIDVAIARQGWCRLQAAWRRSAGGAMWGDCVVTPVVESEGNTNGYVAVIRDVSDEHQRTLKLMDEALKDPLTGLYNRRGLEQRLDALRNRPNGAPRVQTWIMADIDHFKRVNDTYGHDGGDAVLKAVADAIQTAARDGDTRARLGGEEFALLLPDASLEVAAHVAERLREAVAGLAVETGGQVVRVTSSFGVAEQAAGETWTAALERADAALYLAKQQGRNRVVVSGG